MKKLKDQSPYQTLGYKIDKPATNKPSGNVSSVIKTDGDLRTKRGKQ